MLEYSTGCRNSAPIRVAIVRGQGHPGGGTARRFLAGQNSGRFRRQSRLLKHADFDRVYRNGRRHFAAHMTFFYLRTSGDQPLGPRVGLTVGRAFGGAVARNRLKRRLREAVRFSLGRLSVPVDVVINPKRSAVAAGFPELQTEVWQGFRAIEEKVKKLLPAQATTRTNATVPPAEGKQS